MKLLKIVVAAMLVAAIISSFSVCFAAESSDPDLTWRDDFMWGVNKHSSQINGQVYGAANLEQQIHLAAELGVGFIRTGVDTNNISLTDKTVMLANSYGIKIMLCINLPTGRNVEGNGNYDFDSIRTTFRTYAERYNGKNGYGKVDFIQIDNELDNWLMERYGVATEGSSINNYNENDLKELSLQMAAAADGIKEADSDVKSVINFAFRHYGMLDYFDQNGVDFDIIGHDWYSDGMQYDVSKGKTPYQIGDELWERFEKPIIVCESNIFVDQLVDQDPSAWDIVVECMEDCYSRDYVIGYSFYELCDELGRQQPEQEFEREAHFGLVYTDINGVIGEPKPIYNRIRSIIGGEDVEMLDWDTVEASYMSQRKEFVYDDEDENIVQNDTSGATVNEESSSVNVIEKHNVVEITPDPIVKKNTKELTTVKKIPVSSGKLLMWPVITAIIIGALALCYTAFTAVFILRKKKLNTAKIKIKKEI